MNNQNDKEDMYDLRSLRLPYLSGTVLRLFVSLLESPLRKLLLPNLFKSAGITWFREQNYCENPTMNPGLNIGFQECEQPCMSPNDWPSPPIETGPGFQFSTTHDYAKAYREGTTSPLQVAQKILEAIRNSDSVDPPLRAFIAVKEDDLLQQAEAATQRIQSGQPLSILDGVPVAVKDEVDMAPYPTTVGTSFLGTHPAEEDSTVVASVRQTGALLIGKANMHEIGIGVTGFNSHHGTTRNPYNPAHYTGGSASGPASAVAAGFCPFAIGADGGGSVRIPSSFCGLVGLKATFGRISEYGAAPLCWSVAHIGPIAATATDAALAYAVMAGPDHKDPVSLNQPYPNLDRWNDLDLSDLKLGVYWPWFRHATADTVSACEWLLGQLEIMGAQINEISIPGLEAGRIAHTITISSEMTQGLNQYYAEHHREHGLDVRINLALARQFTARDYLQSQQVRTQMINTFLNILENVDAIITPTTALPAPAIPKTALPDGDSDLSTLIEIMRFVTPANLTGLPAISFPAGYNESGLPIGMQAIGRAWNEHTLLRLSLAAERVIERKAPQVFYKILDD